MPFGWPVLIFSLGIIFCILWYYLNYYKELFETNRTECQLIKKKARVVSEELSVYFRIAYFNAHDDELQTDL